jgi:hypothetical protein
MDTSEVLRRAWEAVEKSGVPESLHAVALQAAVEDIRAQDGGGPGEESSSVSTTPDGRGRSRTKAHPGGRAASQEDAAGVVDEAMFFSNLAAESGVNEKDLRDVLTYSGGAVHVSPPTRELGANVAEQARTVIALVAGARSYGMNERPVSADAVRAELERKRCYQSNHFAAKHLGPLRGFNAGATRAEIVTTSRWVDEFSAAVRQLLGRADEEN